MDEPYIPSAVEQSLDRVRRGGDMVAPVTLAAVRVSRWRVELDFMIDGRKLTMVTDAGSEYTERDHVWWGTLDEHETWDL